MDLGDTSLQPIRLLGKGGFGTVYLCRQLEDRNHLNVCVKRIDINGSPSDYNGIKGEIYILSQLKHPHIVNYLRSFTHAGFVNIVMEYAPNGTLRDLLRRRSNRPAVTKTQLLRYFCDILMGLEYLHIRQVMHRDLKPENLLLGAQDQVKIADFGISVVGINTHAHWQGAGTLHYMAPEILNRSKFEYKSDIWSLGVVLYEMCCGYTPFRQASSMQDLKYLIGKLSRRGLCQTIWANYGANWANICEEMLIYNVTSRISLPEIISIDPLITITYYHKYFDYKY